MMRKIIIFHLYLMLLIFSSCDYMNKLNPKLVNAVVVILGRHANANAFSDYYYKEVENYIKDTVYGGYIGVVLGDGNPQVIESFDYFITDATNDRTRNEKINEYSSIVLGYLKDENDKKKRAEKPENDLLKAIEAASRVLNFFEETIAKKEGKTIIKKQVIIIDTGIVTTGDMNFLRLGIDNISFGDLSEEQHRDVYSYIAETLDNKKLLPKLNGVDVVFIGFGDVAMPQDELSNSVEDGIKNIWRAILEKCNVANIDIKEYPKGSRANEFTGDNSGFPYVTPIRFEQSIIKEIKEIYADQVGFIADSADYLNQENADIVLQRYADDLIKYLNRKPEVKIYVIGSIARANLVRDYSTDLSERRANTVKATLIKFGVPKEKMEVFGLGEFYPNREDEFPKGVFVEKIARNNRKVVLIPSNFTSEVKEVLSVRAELAKRRRF